MATFIGVTAAQLLRYVIGAGMVYNAGEVAAFDIRAPHRLIYVSDVETNRQRDLAEASVAPIFTPPDAQTSRRQMSLAYEALDYIQQIRTERDVGLDERVRKLTSLDELVIRESTARNILALDDAQWNRVSAQTLAVLDAVLRRSIHPGNLDETRAIVPQLISFSLRAEEADIVNQLVSALIVPNTNYDSAATEAARRAARENVKPVERKYEANQIIIRSGQVIGPAEIEALERFNLRRPALSWTHVVSALILSALTTTALGIGMLHAQRNVFKRPIRETALSAALFILALALARWLLPGHGVLPYLAPLAAVSIAITSWSGLLPGIISALLMGVLVGLGMDKQPEFMACITASGITACLTLGRAERLSNFLRAGVMAGAAQSLIVLAFNLPTAQPNDAPLVFVYLIASLAGGALSAGLALAILYISGALFDVTTVVQLIELSRLSHPLLQQMVTQAPGTYHHTLMVTNLAENAAERIGADSLLTRVGSYFHDIGKLANPHFFIENQLEGLNPHEQLDPLTSSTILQNHVTDGLKLAAKYRLPSRVRAFIAEHHGTTKTLYQYARACEQSGCEVDARPFRYPGPRPQSKETALLMLADGSEAAVRANRCTSVEEMDEVLRRLFADRLADHQLDDSDLTLREMEVVRQSFLETLRGVYHPRMRYPAQFTTSKADAEPKIAAKPLPPTPDQELAVP
ncbi:MAG: HDIG domain-containing protein [Anaerolineae bacterium]|nr:HDIG domain-containing protein [Anaerolineae bacterium]